jgi:hypothetical protein
MVKIKYFVILLLIIPLISANGLFISETDVQINKTNGVDKDVIFNIKNEENFKFYNITTDNNILKFTQFDLNSGESKNITATISRNEDFDGQIRFKGNYYTDLGQSNKTQNIEIDSTGLDICNIDLIMGDSVNWINNFEGDVKLKNTDTGEYFQTISGNSNYTEKFTEVLKLKYQVFKTGLPITGEICEINIQPTEGYIHSLKYDFIMNLDLNIIYEPTTVNATFYENSYTMDYNAQTEDVFLIKNTGSKIAKNIKLSREWFSFSSNNFDLQPNEQKAITYTIKPLIYETNQTNQSYTENITISGNFETLKIPIDIFINHKDIRTEGVDFTFDLDDALNFVSLLCLQYPETDECRLLSGDYIPNQQDNVTFQIGRDAYIEALLEDDKFREEVRAFQRNQNELLAYFNSSLAEVQFQNNATKEDLKKVITENEDLRGIVIFGASSIGAIIIFLILGFLIKEYSGKGYMSSYAKGEKLWQ